MASTQLPGWKVEKKEEVNWLRGPLYSSHPGQEVMAGRGRAGGQTAYFHGPLTSQSMAGAPTLGPGPAWREQYPEGRPRPCAQ